MQGFHLKLRKHLLPRLKTMMNNEVQNLEPRTPSGHSTEKTHEMELNSIYFKNDLLYKHNIMRINYTSYDIRRSQDTINPNTDHCDIMILAPRATGDMDDTETHQYRYARVIGIYHANIIFVPPGLGTKSYKARRVEFLWVRWFDVVGGHPVQWGWKYTRLDRLKFLPIRDEGAFGFVDPEDVLRSCHIIPRFSMGQFGTEDTGVSKSAKDGHDWREYYTNRSVFLHVK